MVESGKRLKTLKDLEDDICFPPLKPQSIGQLQDAAREWIKKFEEMELKYKLDLEETKIVKASDQNYVEKEELEDLLILSRDVCNWIKYFFNLEDE